MARRKDHTRDQLRNLIIESAWRIVGEEGWDAVTARKVTTGIGYVQGTLYNVFSSMEELRLALNGRTLDKLLEVLNQNACNDPGSTPSEKLKAMARLYREFALAYHPYWLMLFTHTQPDRSSIPDWYLEKIRRLFATLEGQLQDICPDRRLKQAARILWSSVHGIFFLEDTGKMPLISGDDSTVALAEYFIDIFIAGLEREA